MYATEIFIAVVGGLISLTIVIVGALPYAVVSMRTRLDRGVGEVIMDERDRRRL